MSAPITLYCFVPFDRSGRVRWFLEELGRAYEDRPLDFGSGESRGAEYRAISPAGKVPALVDGETKVFETAAALAYLAETYDDGRLVPGPGDPCRAAYLSWMSFLSATVDPVVFSYLRPDVSDEERPPLVAQADKEVPRYLDAIAGQLGEKDTMLARGFTPVDIQAAAVLDYARVGGKLEGRETLSAYLAAMKARPAAVAAKTFRS